MRPIILKYAGNRWRSVVAVPRESGWHLFSPFIADSVEYAVPVSGDLVFCIGTWHGELCTYDCATGNVTARKSPNQDWSSARVLVTRDGKLIVLRTSSGRLGVLRADNLEAIVEYASIEWTEEGKRGVVVDRLRIEDKRLERLGWLPVPNSLIEDHAGRLVADYTTTADGRRRHGVWVIDPATWTIWRGSQRKRDVVEVSRGCPFPTRPNFRRTSGTISNPSPARSSGTVTASRLSRGSPMSVRSGCCSRTRD